MKSQRPNTSKIFLFDFFIMIQSLNLHPKPTSLGPARLQRKEPDLRAQILHDAKNKKFQKSAYFEVVDKSGE